MWIGLVGYNGVGSKKAVRVWQIPPRSHVDQLNVIVVLVAGEAAVGDVGWGAVRPIVAEGVETGDDVYQIA